MFVKNHVCLPGPSLCFWRTYETWCLWIRSELGIPASLWGPEENIHPINNTPNKSQIWCRELWKHETSSIHVLFISREWSLTQNAFTIAYVADVLLCSETLDENSGVWERLAEQIYTHLIPMNQAAAKRADNTDYRLLLSLRNTRASINAICLDD